MRNVFTISLAALLALATPVVAQDVPPQGFGGSGGVASDRTISTTSPLTGGGDLSADRTIAFISSAQRLVLATPSGSSGVPTLRALVEDDIPYLPTNKINAGILALERGSTGVDGTAATNGDLLIGNSGAWTIAKLTGTANQVSVTNGAGTITLATPQSIGTGSSVTFAQVRAANGSAATPSHSFTNSTGSGLYYTGTTNTIALATAGSARMTLGPSAITVATDTTLSCSTGTGNERFGASSMTPGIYGTASGAGANADTIGAAFGASANASSYGCAIGTNTIASGLGSVALGSSDGGQNTTASGDRSIAIGYYARALHEGSLAVGDTVVTTAANQAVFGNAGGSYPITKWCFNGTSSLYPGIDLSSTTFRFQLADGSAPAPVLSKRLVSTKTSGHTVLALESGTCYDNAGATARVDFALPAASPGLTYTFMCTDADGLRVTANGSDQIRLLGSASGAGGRIDTTTIGASVTLVCTDNNIWLGVSVVGTIGPASDWVVTEAMQEYREPAPILRFRSDSLRVAA